MTTNTESSRNGSFAVIVATASVTLAVGVTVAALSGYLTRPVGPALPDTSPPDAPVPSADMQLPADNGRTAEPAFAAVDTRRSDEPWHHHDRDDEGDDDD